MINQNTDGYLAGSPQTFSAWLHESHTAWHTFDNADPLSQSSALGLMTCYVTKTYYLPGGEFNDSDTCHFLCQYLQVIYKRTLCQLAVGTLHAEPEL